MTLLAVYSGGEAMAYEIVAEKDSQTVRMKRSSSLLAIAKARVWASEGWEVTIVFEDEESQAHTRERAA
jgi:hypothetical protein